MLEIRITAPELSEAINNLANAISAKANPGITKDLSIPTEPAGQVVAPQAQVQAPNVPPAAPTQPPVQSEAPAQIPTAAPQYTLDMIAKAGTALVDAGRIADVTALLAKYGVEALTALNPSMYGAIAMELRALGAPI